MWSLNDMLIEYTDLALDDRQWLQALVHEWHVLADMSFSDLILWVADPDDNVFWAVAQVRPSTGPTALEDDVVGDEIVYDPEHAVTEAYLSHEITATNDNSLSVGIPVAVWAVPIMRRGRCIAVVERHTNQMGVRAPGALEDTYVETANLLSIMLRNAEFPVHPPTDPSISPKVGDGIIRTSPDRVITYASPNAVSAYRRLGYAGDMEGEDFRAVTQLLASDLRQVGQVFATDFSGRLVREVDLDNGHASMRLRIIPLILDGGSAGMLVLVRDTTEIRNRERQLVTKDATIREIHHRVKNNLQTVAALLRLQSRRLSSEEGREALRDATRRVASIALVHEILSQAFDEDVVFDDVTDRILRMVGDVAAADGKVSARREGSFGLVPAAVATGLSLVVTELCQNAIEHGLDQHSGTVRVVPERHPSWLQVSVIDDGQGLPEGFGMADTKSLGLSIVQTLVSDLGGSVELQNRGDARGSVARVRIPLNGKGSAPEMVG